MPVSLLGAIPSLFRGRGESQPESPEEQVVTAHENSESTEGLQTHEQHGECSLRMSEEQPPKATEYTIDELAAAARVPSRTIRFYQSKGALPKPEIRGRVAYYGASHVERLELIASLQDRGLSIKAIRDLLEQVDKGELALNEWLGLEARLQEPWAHDHPKVVTEPELHELLGDRRPGLVADLLRLKVIEKQGHSYMIRSPALMNVGLKLEAAGVDLETATGAANLLRKHLERAASELATYFYRRTGEGFGSTVTAEDIAKAYEAIRPRGLEAVKVMFAREIETAVRKLVESGATSEIPAKARKARAR
ncbi:MAG: MerR family transcriptional regulator [Polyangiaceae bacterium]